MTPTIKRSIQGLLGQLLLALGLPLALSTPAVAQVAPRPPMGWNSWDAYGFTIDEAAFKANAAHLARWRAQGWSYAVIDEGWYMADPAGANLAARQYKLDGFGRPEPVTARFPSSADGHGLKGLADWTHAQGLKFGIHVVRGIPKAAVEANLPIAGSAFRAADAADRAATCPWDEGNFGIADNAAGQAYYDSLVVEYAAWGVDFLKVDCIADHPYRSSEIAQLGRAIRKAGRTMVLSLSPGPARIENTEAMAASAQMWRISDDFWDGWTFPHPDPKSSFPTGVLTQFDNLARWNSHVSVDRWPDADMLPFGSLRPSPGWGKPRASRLTPAEVRTAFILWAIARSPLILGGNLTEIDAATEKLLTNSALTGLNQTDRRSRPMALTDLAGARVWLSAPAKGAPDTLALFNVSDAPLVIDRPWRALGFKSERYLACDLLSGQPVAASRLTTTVAPHDVIVFRLRSARNGPSDCGPPA